VTSRQTFDPKAELSQSQPVRMPIPQQVNNHVLVAINHHCHTSMWCSACVSTKAVSNATAAVNKPQGNLVPVEHDIIVFPMGPEIKQGWRLMARLSYRLVVRAILRSLKRLRGRLVAAMIKPERHWDFKLYIII
jgi:hypothetical protein